MSMKSLDVQCASLHEYKEKNREDEALEKSLGKLFISVVKKEIESGQRHVNGRGGFRKLRSWL